MTDEERDYEQGFIDGIDDVALVIIERLESAVPNWDSRREILLRLAWRLEGAAETVRREAERPENERREALLRSQEAGEVKSAGQSPLAENVEPGASQRP